MSPSPSATPSISPPSWTCPEEVVPDDAVSASGSLENVKRAGSWFFWIAALSLLNSIIGITGANWAFIFGLIFTQVCDAGMVQAPPKSLALAVCMGANGAAIAIFCGLGYYARQCKTWAFVVGAILYLMDAGLALMGHDSMSLAFHAFVIFRLFSGIKSTLSAR